jgi:hypothetical protein
MKIIVLSPPESEKDFTIETDVSIFGIGAVFLLEVKEDIQ